MTSIQPGRVPWNTGNLWLTAASPKPQAVLAARARGAEVSLRLTAWSLKRRGRVAGRGEWVKEMPLSCGFSGGYPILWRFYAGFLVLPRKTGGIPRVFTAPRPSQGDAVNKAELTAALAMRTKMSKADAGRAIEALFDDKGIIAGELKKGGVIQIKASIAPAFRAGKQLKQVVNKK